MKKDFRKIITNLKKHKIEIITISIVAITLIAMGIGITISNQSRKLGKTNKPIAYLDLKNTIKVEEVKKGEGENITLEVDTKEYEKDEETPTTPSEEPTTNPSQSDKPTTSPSGTTTSKPSNTPVNTGTTNPTNPTNPVNPSQSTTPTNPTTPKPTPVYPTGKFVYKPNYSVKSQIINAIQTAIDNDERLTKRGATVTSGSSCQGQRFIFRGIGSHDWANLINNRSGTNYVYAEDEYQVMSDGSEQKTGMTYVSIY